MEFVETRDAEVVILGPIGSLGAASARELEAKLAELMEAGIRTYLIDFERVDAVSAAALRVLITFARRLEPLSGQVLLASLNESVAEVFEIAGLGSLLALALSRREAALELGQKRRITLLANHLAPLLGIPTPRAVPPPLATAKAKELARLADHLAHLLGN